MTSLLLPEPNRTEPNRTEPNRTEPNRTELASIAHFPRPCSPAAPGCCCPVPPAPRARGVRRLLLAGAWVFLLAALALPGVARADVMASNMDQTATGGLTVGDFKQAQAFTVDTDNDYTLTSITIPFASGTGLEGISSTNIDSLTVSVWSAASSGRPDTSLFALTNPSEIAAGDTASFAAPAGATVEAGETYVVVIDYDVETDAVEVGSTRSDAEDDSGKAGWSIDDKSFALDNRVLGASWTTNSLTSLRIRVNGAVRLVSNIDQAAVSSVILGQRKQAQAFTVDADNNYTLTSITIPFASGDGLEGISSTNISSLTVSVWSATSADKPDASLYTFTNPSSIAAGDTASFVAPAGATVEAGKTYVVVFDYGVDTEAVKLRTTDSNAEDDSGKAGMSIADEGLSLDNRILNASWQADAFLKRRIRINGCTNPPQITKVEITSEPLAEDTYAQGEEIELTVTFHQPVEVSGTVNATLVIGDSWRTVSYHGRSGTDALAFRLTVEADDVDSDGIAIRRDTLAKGAKVPQGVSGGGSIKGVESGYDADLDSLNVRNDDDHKVDGSKLRRLDIGADRTEDEGSNFDITVTLSEVSTEAVSVSFRGTGGTATGGTGLTPGRDYGPDGPTTVTIAAGATEAQLTFSIVQDEWPELEEYFFLELHSPTKAVLGRAEARITIRRTTPTRNPGRRRI